MDLDRRLIRMAVSVCFVHRLQRKSRRTIREEKYPKNYQHQPRTQPSRIESHWALPLKENRFGKLHAHVAARSHWQIESCQLTPRSATCASESPSHGSFESAPNNGRAKSVQKCAKKTHTQMQTHINCAFVSINEQRQQFKDMKNFGTENDFPHTHTRHTRTVNALGNYLVHFMPHYLAHTLCACHFCLIWGTATKALEMSTWVVSSVCLHTLAHTRTHSRAISYDSF